MPKMAVRTEIVLVLVAVGIVLAACSGSSGNGTGVLGGPCPSKTPAVPEIEGDMTTDELVNLVAEAMTCPGYAFHMRSAGDTESGPYSSYSETEVWVDMENNLGRVEQRSRFTSEEALAEAAEDGYDPEFRSTGIVRSDGRYSSQQDEQPAGKGRPPGCHGPGQEALGLVLPCLDGPLQYFEISIDPNGSYNGHDAIAYVAEGESSGSDETYYTTSRLYFRQDTFMPIGASREGTLDIGEIFPVQADFPYETGFVSLDSLPEDFFDPASIGYVKPDPEDVEMPLDDAEIEVYWLGREFESSDEYPALELHHVFARARSQSGEGGFVVEMTYLSAEDEFGRPAVRIWLYPPAAWEFREEHSIQNPCEEIADVEFEGARALVIRKYHDLRQSDSECPPHDRFAAEVHLEDLIIEIDAPTTGDGRENFPSPYDTEAAMELLIRSLVLRE